MDIEEIKTSSGHTVMLDGEDKIQSIGGPGGEPIPFIGGSARALIVALARDLQAVRAVAVALQRSATTIGGDNGPLAVTVTARAPEPEIQDANGRARKAHYGDGRQPWDDIKDLGWAPAFAAGNVLKYIRRHAKKNGADDISKARWYYARLLEMAFPTTATPAGDIVYAHHVRKQLLATLDEDECGLLANVKAGDGF